MIIQLQAIEIKEWEVIFFVGQDHIFIQISITFPKAL